MKLETEEEESKPSTNPLKRIVAGTKKIRESNKREVF